MNSTLPDETKRMLILSEMPDSVIRGEMANGNPLAGEAAAHKGIGRYGVPIALGITAVPAATAFGLGAAAPVIADTALPAVGAAVNWAAGTAPGQTLTATAGSPLLWGSLAVENAAEKTYRNIRYGEPITWNDVAQTGIDMALATLPPEKVLKAVGGGYDALKHGRIVKESLLKKIIDGLEKKGIKGQGGMDQVKAAVSYFENMGYGKEDLVRMLNRGLNEDEIKKYAEKIYMDLFDKRYNGLLSKAIDVPKDVELAYYKNLSEADKLVDEYYAAIGGNKKPFEFFLSEKPEHKTFLNKYVMAKPTWLNYVGDGSKIPLLRRTSYNKMYKQFTDDDFRRIGAFMSETGLPMESVIQILSPEYYRFMKETNTPMISAVFTKEGVAHPYYFTRKAGVESEIRTDLLKNYGAMPGTFQTYVPEYDVEFISKPHKSVVKKFAVSDLDDLINNVQYIGNTYPHSSRIYLGGQSGHFGGSGATNAGSAYGTFNPFTADLYAHRAGNFNQAQLGKRNAVTVAGKPFFGDNFVMKGGKWINARDNVGNYAIAPESVGYEALRRLNNEGFDWFVDFGVENQFSTGNPFYVKNLVGNNGAFSINDINWFHDKGGELRKQ